MQRPWQFSGVSTQGNVAVRGETPQKSWQSKKTTRTTQKHSRHCAAVHLNAEITPDWLAKWKRLGTSQRRHGHCTLATNLTENRT
jgi:hypothetical protein